MPALASQQVINAVAARLVAAATGAGARVYTDRFYPVSLYPSIKVKHVDEDLQAADDDVTWPAVRLHVLQVDVDCMARAVSGLDGALSDLAAQVLLALEGVAAPITPLPVALTAAGIRYQAAADGEAAVGIATVRIEAQFHTAANNPTTLI